MMMARWSPSRQPQSALVRKWEPVVRKTCTARAHVTVSESCGTSIRNRGIWRLSVQPSLLVPIPGVASHTPGPREAALASEHNRLGSSPHAKLVEDVRRVVSDGLLAD